jgi:hypothetical protein
VDAASLAGGPAPGVAAAGVAAAIARLQADWGRRYGEVVGDVRAVLLADGSVALEGVVLVPHQRPALLGAAARALAGVPLVDRLTVLTEDEATRHWLEPGDGLLDVWVGPGRQRATQLAAGDPPARCLVERGEWWAVELADGTVGWVRAAESTITAAEHRPADIAAWRRDYRGTARAVPEAAWRHGLQPWLGAPYLWGGTTPMGIDCSGLTQRLVRSVAGLGLPRHSTDQVRRGRRVPRETLQPGDLVLLGGGEAGVRHVAIVLQADPVVVGHASRRHDAVREEPLASLLARYELQAAARFDPEGSG